MAPRNTALAALGALAFSVGLIACNPATTSPSSPGGGATVAPTASIQAGAEAQACAAIQAWSNQMRALVSMDPTTASVDDVRTQVGNIKTAWGDVKTSLEKVQSADETAVLNAGKQLETALDSVSTSVPVAQTIDQVKAGAAPLKGVYQEMANGLGCTLTNPY